MRYILYSILFFISLPASVFGTHIVGGSLTYERISPGYIVVDLIVERDLSGAGYDNPATLWLMQNNFSPGSYELEVDSLFYYPLSDDTCIAPSYFYGLYIERVFYHDTLPIPSDSTEMVLIYTRCCRNGDILNIQDPGTVGASIYAVIPPTATVMNDSPRWNQEAPIYVCASNGINWDHGATDADGDSLHYAFDYPTASGSMDPLPMPVLPIPQVPFAPGYSLQNFIDASPAFQIDPITGQITGMPTTIGRYQFHVSVEEWRSGIKIGTIIREFQLNVTPCDPIPEIELKVITDPCSGLTQCFSRNDIPGYYQYIRASSLQIKWTESDTTDTVCITFPDTGLYYILSEAIPDTSILCHNYDTLMLYISHPDEQYDLIIYPDTLCFEDAKGFGAFLTPDPPEGAHILWEVNNEELPLGNPPQSGNFHFGANKIRAKHRRYGCDLIGEGVLYLDSCFEFIVPNVFTPNGDGIFDHWLPVWDQPPSRLEVVIFNRWGNEVWRSVQENDLGSYIGWNGLVERSGQPCPEGTYYFLLKAEFDHYGVHTKKGNITLLR